MPDDIDKSLLERLQALRGAGSPQAGKPNAGRATAGLVEKANPATREDPLTARLKSLRLQYGEPSSSSSPAISALKSSPKADRIITHGESASSEHNGNPGGPSKDDEVVDVDAMFQTDIKTLEEMLGHVGIQDTGPDEASDHEIRTLLNELSQSIPLDVQPGDRPFDDVEEKDVGGNSDDEEEHLDREADQAIARFRDEMELEATLGEDTKDNHENDGNERDEEDEEEDEEQEDTGVDHLALPSLPSTLDDLPLTTFPTLSPSTTTRATSADIDDITARMAKLKSPGTKPNSSIGLPSVPDSKPSSEMAINRLTSKTTYTDEDMDTWCTVCLEDATLQCPACDDDVYCARCWREMHVGPAAAFDDRSHKAVMLTKTKKKKKVAVGAA